MCPMIYQTFVRVKLLLWYNLYIFWLQLDIVSVIMMDSVGIYIGGCDEDKRCYLVHIRLEIDRIESC